MYAIQRLQERQWCITLPANNALSRPWGFPRNVYLLANEVPTLVDTGYASSRDALLAALNEAGVSPASIQRVVLTSQDAGAAGNVEAFENAAVWAPKLSDAARGAGRRWRAYVLDVLRALTSVEDAPEAWSRLDLEEILRCLEPPELSQPLLPLNEGMPLRLDDGIFDVLLTPGCGEGGAAFYDASRRVLYGGPCVTWTSRPVVRDYGDFADAVGRVSRLSLAELRPVQGLVETSPDVFFRMLGLFVTNMRSNMQYVLNQPASAFDLAFADFGYLPDDLQRFAGSVLEFDSVLREFDSAGVVKQSGGDEPLPRWTMGTPKSRY